jgi:hypothetical protein
MLSENWLCVIDSNLNYSKRQAFGKIRLLGAQILAKIKLEMANAQVSFVYSSH